MLKLTLERLGAWDLIALRFAVERGSVPGFVIAPIGNSVADSERGKQRTADWKVKVAREVQRRRPEKMPMAAERYAVTIGFSFHFPSHGNQKLDVENFMKPTLDAIACGIFGAENLDPETVARWHFDDSRFGHLLIHRLPDAATLEGEGAALLISCG